MEKINIKIQKSFWEAFLYFLRALRYEKLNFILEELPIPQFLIKKSYLIPTSKKGVMESWQTFFLFIVSLKLFAYYWIVFHKEILRVLRLLHSEKKLLDDISQKIPQYTHCNWSYEEILMYPVIGKWAAERFGKLYLGITPISFSSHEIRGIIIHEIIHINASAQGKKEIGDQLKNSDLADELAVVIITRAIQRDILNIPTDDLQALTDPLGNIISEKELASLEKVAARGVSFQNLLIYCDRALPKDIS